MSYGHDLGKEETIHSPAWFERVLRMDLRQRYWEASWEIRYYLPKEGRVMYENCGGWDGEYYSDHLHQKLKVMGAPRHAP